MTIDQLVELGTMVPPLGSIAIVIVLIAAALAVAVRDKTPGVIGFAALAVLPITQLCWFTWLEGWAVTTAVALTLGLFIAGLVVNPASKVDDLLYIGALGAALVAKPIAAVLGHAVVWFVSSTPTLDVNLTMPPIVWVILIALLVAISGKLMTWAAPQFRTLRARASKRRNAEDAS